MVDNYFTTTVHGVSLSFLFPYTFCTVALRRNPPARNPREGVVQYIKKERKKVSDWISFKSKGQ